MNQSIVCGLCVLGSLLLSGCGSDLSIVSATPQANIPSPDPADVRDLAISNEIWEPNENKLEVEDTEIDTQTFVFRFADAEQMKFEIARGSTYGVGCATSSVKQSFVMVAGSTETKLETGKVIEKPKAEGVLLKVTLSGLSSCMGYGTGFLVVRR